MASPKSVTLYSNASSSLVMETTASRRNVLRLTVHPCESVNVADAMALIAALQAFYSMNTVRFAQLIDINATYPPSPNVILATINLMRETHAHFKTHLEFSGVILGEHAEVCQKYMRAYTPTRPILYAKDADTFFAVLEKTPDVDLRAA